jgi:nudix-type nucleoside diphosphatase (YffH/AdpP family)
MFSLKTIYPVPMNRTVEILQRREVFKKFFRIEEVTLRHELYNGSMSAEMTRLILDRGDSVAMLLCDPEKQTVLLCEQFRVPTYDKGPGWLLELPAGTLEQGEDAEECARREAMEETGYSVKSFRRITSVYLSPGGSSERIHIFYGEVSMSDRLGAGGGVLAENEDIRLISMPVAEAIAKARDGQIQDAKTLIGLQWLELKASGAQ